VREEKAKKELERNERKKRKEFMDWEKSHLVTMWAQKNSERGG